MGRDGRTLTILVDALEPGTAYGFILNLEDFLPVQDRDGRPIAPTEIRFRTRPAASPVTVP